MFSDFRTFRAFAPMGKNSYWTCRFPSLQPTLRQPSTSTIPTTLAALRWSPTLAATLPRMWCISRTARCLWKSAMAVGLLHTSSTPRNSTKKRGCIIMGHVTLTRLRRCGWVWTRSSRSMREWVRIIIARGIRWNTLTLMEMLS